MWIPPLPPYRCETGPPRRPGASFKLAQFRQRKTKGDSPGSKKKASKRKSSTVHEAVQEKEEERAVEPPEGELPSDVAQSVAGPEPADGVSGAPEAKAERGLSSLGTPKSSIPELIVQGPGLEDNTPSLATEPRAQEATIKMLEEKLVDKQEDIDLLSQEVGELQAQLAQCSEAAQLQQELEMAVQERDRIIVQLTSNLQLVRQNHEDDQQEVLLLASQIQGLQLQLQENSELLKSKTPAKGCLSQSQLQAAASLQGPREPNPPSQGWDLEKLPASSQKNFKEKEAAFAQMEEHGKSASQQPSQVVSEKEGMISSLQDQLGLAGNAGASAQHALSVKSSKVIELKREKQDCMEESQVPPPREACGPLLQNLGDELGETCELGVAEARKAYGDTDGKSWGASPVPGLRGSEQQSLGGLGIDFSSQFLELAACAMPESHRATFQEERNGAEHLENDDHKKRKLPSAEKIVEEALASKGDDEIQNLLNFHVRESNEKMLQETENSGELRLKHGMTLGQANWEERTLLGQKAELQGMPRKLCLRPRESDRHEVGCRDGLQTCCLNSEEENPSLELGEHEDDQLEVGSLQDEVSSEESRMEETRDLMEKYLVSTERDQSRVSEAPDHFDLETALQRRSERESLDFLSDELIIGLDGNIDSNVLFEGNSVQVESYAAPWTDRQEPSGFSQGDLSEILELMDKDKAYLMQRCVKLSHLLREKELALKTFSQEVEEEVAEERWWEGKHRLLNVLSQEGGGSCDEIVPRLKGEEHIKLGTTAGGITDLAGWASVTHQPHCHVMDEVSQKEEGGRSGKIASASVGLEALCSQEENRPPGQLRVHKPRSHMPAGCSSQKITLEESLLQEVETLKAEMAIKENLFTQVVEEKNTLEEKFTKDRENLEENILELIEKIKCLEKGLGHEKVGFAGKSTSVLSEDQKLDAKRKVQESDFLSTENSPIQQTISLKNAQVEPEWLLQEEAQKATCALEDVRSELSSYHEKQMSQMKHQHEQERTELRREHQKEVEATRKEMKEKLEEQQQRWEQERREQISAIKKIHEREHDREIAELVSKHKEEMTQLRDELHSKHQQMMEGLQQQMQASHRAEMQQAQLQAQTLHTLELEALRLSLSNMHTAQLELTQANLRKEKETALVELREMLNDKRAQELALLQSRLQFELEHVREQHRKEKEEMALKHQQERADLGKKLELQVETQARTLETLRGDWASERDSSLRRLQEELATKHQAEMESLRGALRAQLAEQQAELDKMGHDKSQAEATLRSLQAQHQLALQDLRQELQLQHDQYLEDLNLKCREKQTELDTLQASYEELKVQSHREIQQLWAQLDSTRASRHELNELKEQLVARTSHVEELERLKHGFEQRQRQWRNEHETELEQLRVYFEQKLRDAEESYREDLHLLQQRLREVREDSFLDSEDVSLSVGFVEEEAEMERKAHLEQLILQLEQHKDGIAHLRLQLEGKHREESATLEASLRARHEEEVRKVKADLSEKHAAHVEDLKQQHRLQLDQLRGGLSEEHRKDITKLHLQCAQLAARQVEAEVAERVSVLEDDHLARVAQLQSEEQLISQLREQVDLARRENMELQEKVQQEVRLREEAEKMRCRLVKDHQTEIERMKEEIRQMIQKDQGREDAWRAQSEESLAALALELNGKAEQERQALRQALEAHVTELEQLRDRQAADIARLETSLGEARAQEEATGRLREECALELQANRARFLEEQREMMQKATEKQDVLLRELQDKHASELQIQSQQLEKRHGQQTEALTAELQSQHLEEMDALRTSLQAQHQAQLEARETELQAQHQAQLEARETELQAQHQAQLEARETELQAQHQAQLEARETELQVQHQAQLEARETELQAQHQAQLEAWEAELQAQHQAELETHVAELQARHLGQLEARAAEMQAQHRAQVEAQEAELQDRHRAQVAVLQAQHASETSGLEAKHLSNLDSLESCYLSEIQTIQEEHNRELEQLQARLEEQLREKDTQYEELLAQEKEKHQQELQQAQESLKIEMTTKHIEKLKALTAQLQDAHQEDLQAALHRQRALLEEDHHKALDILREEVVRMEEQHRSALGELKDIHTAELGKLQEELGSLRAQHKRDREEEARAAAAQSEEAKRQRELLFQQEMELLKGQSEVVLAQQMAQLKEDLETEKRAALREAEELLALEREKAQALCQREEALTLQLQEQSGLILQLKEKVLSLNSEVSESHEELKKLQERRHREHEEGTNLLSLLRSDMDHTQNERKTLQETNQWLLSLFGDTLKATIAMRSQISKRIGICLDEDSLSKESRPMGTPGQLAQGACQLPGDMSPEGPIPPLDFDQTMPECDETLLPECDETLLPGNDISCHVRESFFLSPEVTVECEQPIRRIYQSLGAAVDNLLEMTLDSNKQLEETRERHARFEKEFNRKNEETAQVARQHQELMDCLNQESAAKNQLAVELHKAEGLAEGYRAEKAALEEALAQKEESEHRLAVELENLKAQFQALTREQAKLKEEQNLLLRQKEMLIVEAEEKAAALRKEVEHLVREQAETRQQSEKDCASLRSHLRALELEVEEQLPQQQELVRQAAEIQDLRQQIVSLDKHLRNQRQFMDEQAIEREHERDEFQQEIQKLEEQLKQQPPKSQPWGEPWDSESFELNPEVESLQRQLREKIDELNELVIKKELAERQLLAQKDEIKNLEDANAEIRKKVSWLEEELEKQKKIGKELRQDKEALQEQQMNNLIQISTLQSKLDEAKHLQPVQGSPSEEDLREQLRAEQTALQLKAREVQNLEDELGELKKNLTSKSEEIVQLNLELALQNRQISGSIQELSAENADLKVMGDTSAEMEELKAIIDNLCENHERFRANKAEEIERLHEVIEKLQKELSVLGPALHELSDSQGDSDGSQAENLQRELAQGLSSVQAREERLPLPPDELGQRLRDESQFRLRVAALEQELQGIRDASAQQLTLKEAEARKLAALARRWKTAARQKEAEVEALNEERGVLLAELETLVMACSRLEKELERKRPAGPHEPPELQMLRAQCVGLNLKLQALSQRLVTYQLELDQHQACGPQCRVQVQKNLMERDAFRVPRTQGPGWLQSGAPAPSQEGHGGIWVSEEGSCAAATTEEESDEDPGPWESTAAPPGQRGGPGPSLAENRSLCAPAPGLESKESGLSVLTVCQEQLESELLLMKAKMQMGAEDRSKLVARMKIQQKPVDVCQLQKGDLITQVRHIQEKLHHLIRSISCRDSHVQVLSHGAPLSPPQRLGSHVPGPAWGQPAAGQSPPPQGPVSTVLQHSWTLHDRTESPDPPGQGGPTPTLDKTPDAWLSSPSDADPSTPDFSCSEDCVAAQRAPPCTETPGSPPPGGSARGSPPSARSAEEASQDADPLDAVQHFRDTILDMDSSSLGSPELVRKDSTLDRLPSVHLTPLSQAADLQSPDSAWRSLGLQDSSGCLAFPALPGLEASPQPSLTEKARPRAGRATEATVSEKDVEDFILTPSNSQEHLESAAPGERGESDGHDNKRSAGLPDKLRQDPERSEAADTRLGARHPPGMVQRPLKPTKDKEMQSKQMKALLKMVCDESQQILVLSKCEAPASDLGSALPAPTPDCFQKERQGLLDAVQALKEHLTRVPARGEEKEPSDTGFDWGGEFLQAVQEVLEKERNMLKIELQSKLCSLDSGDERSLLEKLEDVVKEQGELQKRTLENLHLTDRSSLLSEIQGLRAQLRMTHLQNQEKLQQLYEALTNVEDHGSKQEYQFRRQVELLEYKVEQEKCIVSDLQKTLTEEQEKATENQRLLLAAQNTSQELKAELEECQQEKESAAQALREAQKEAAHLRSLLENQETDLKAALDALQSEKQRGKELQALVEEGQRHSLEQDELRAKAIEELQASLDKQRSQNGQLAVSLQHEQTEKANLKKELQIEYSRCEALLCQERGQVCELQRALEAERAHAAELAEALGHERLVTERLSKRAGEASSQKEAQLQQAFVRKLKEEKGRGAELQVLLDEARQQALAAQKQLELEVQAHREEMKKEKEVSVLLQASADALHKQKQELLRYLEEERAKQGRLQAELEQLQLGPKDEAGPEARRDKDRRREAGSADEDKSKRGKKDKERLGWQRELELQRQRDEHKIQQLQQTISELQNDKGFVPSRGWQECGVGVPLPPNTEKLKEHQEQLQSVRQQLLHAVALLTSFMNQTVNRTINDWASSNEKAVTSLLLTLEELKSELMMTLPQVSSHWMGAGGGARAGPALGVAMRLHSETCFPHCGTKCS
ncbi:pericentrin isoform X6 [Monodelphis domestica]|uniref:pericentrin isoform X6 n=1 Tax=Monodelphis domestica TaxID=13616 RepID=UPI0024E20709|nr:pericentrin isoform X6 [Monodelphis domestica]